MDRAKKLQNYVRIHEDEQREKRFDYDEKHVRQSIVHAREDIVMLVQYMYEMNKNLSKIVYLNGAIIVLMFLLLLVLGGII